MSNKKVSNELQNIGVELDGVKNFITVYNHKGVNTYPLKYKKSSTDSIRFTSMELARTAAEAVFGGPNDKVSYKVTIATKTGSREYNMARAMNVDGYFQLYDTHRNIKYYIKETTRPKVRWIGYISLDNGFNERKDKNYGIQRAKSLFAAIEYASQRLLLANETDSINKVVKESTREYTLYVKNSTAKIHIMDNGSIMDKNQRRKEKGERVLPFEKNVDKFLTVYCYITAEHNEMKFFNSAEKSLDILERLIEDIYNNVEDMETIELVQVNFEGYILDNI